MHISLPGAKYWLTFCCGVLYSFAGGLIAQDALLTPVPRSTVLQSPAQGARLVALEANPRFVQVTPVQLANVWDAQQDGLLTFTLPDMDDQLTVTASSLKPYADDHYTWTGQILGENGMPMGHVIFGQLGNHSFGRIELPDRHFLIRDLEEEAAAGYHVVLELFPGAFTDLQCGTGSGTNAPPGGSDPGGNPPIPPEVEPRDDCHAQLDVLFVYTQEVLDRGANPIADAHESIALLNEILDASAIPRALVRAEVAAVEKMENYNDDIENARFIVETMLPSDQQILGLRDQHNADLVVLFQYSDIYVLVNNQRNYGFVGLASGFGDGINTETIYTVIEAGRTPLITAHEIGHLLGCRHEDGGHAFANAFGFCAGQIVHNSCNGEELRTVMSSAINAAATHFGFSNPWVNFAYTTNSGQVIQIPTGSANANNALMIGETACPIGQFGEAVEGGYFHAWISGPSNVSSDPAQTYNWDSYYYGCTLGGTVSYRWEVSWDYGRSFSYLSDQSTATLMGSEVPLYIPGGLIRLRAICSEGADTSIHILLIQNWSAQHRTGLPLELDDAQPQQTGLFAGTMGHG